MRLRFGKATPHYHFGLIVALLTLASCGHSGGGGPTQPSFVGTYLGTASLALSAPGRSVPINGAIQFVVSSNKMVSVSDPGQPPAGTGPLNGNSFSAVVPGAFFNSPGLTSCGGSVTFSGSISGTSMSGTVSSAGFTCNGVPFTVTGTFTATLRAELPTGGTGGNALQRLKDALGSR